MSKSGRYSADRKKIATVSAAKTVEVAECGTVFMVGDINATITLPDAATAGPGWWCKFILSADLSAGDVVVTPAGSDTVELVSATAADGAAMDVTGTGQVEFINGAATKGDQLEILTDGTSWYALGMAAAATGIDANT